ncbi:MAG: TnpV protein [Clostridia bacterium]|nr:TnpV protein [Clostridia bacterium]
MNKTEILRKAQSDEGMTVAEIKAYRTMVEQKPQVYGKYGTLRLQCLKDKGIDWTIANLPEYLHGIDRQAEQMYEVMYAKLSESEQFKKSGDFLKDLQIETEKKRRIEEEILNELVYA